MTFLDWVQLIVWDYMWGTPLIVIVLGTGALLTVKSGFFQFRYLGHALKKAVQHFFDKDAHSSEDGVVSPLQAMSVAIGTTVGVGNIGGVATAIAFGGPGAIFWMWVAGLTGQIVKMTEITLAVHYRSRNKDGTAYGGPTYYMRKGLGVEHKWARLAKGLSLIFGFGIFMGSIINIQTYTVSEAIAGTFDFNLVAVALVYTVLIYVMTAGGLKGLGKIAGIMVPFMCLFYIGAGIYIILINFEQLPHAFSLIFGSAFTGTAAAGCFAGAAFSQAIKGGMARSVFSNEAGWGTAPMVHASAKVDHPVKQGILGVFEVFVDTLLICTITALVIIVTGQWNSGLDGATLTLSAFETGIGSTGRIVLAIATFLFGVTTSTGMFAQIEVILRHIIGENAKKDTILKIYKSVYPLPALALVLIAVYYQFPGTVVWVFSDASTALPIFANLVTLWLLSPKFIELLKDYKARYMGIGKVDPGFKVFYEDKVGENPHKVRVSGDILTDETSG
ncbi:MAG: sodium:alanine symporter family protein [Candidatus Atribacteria bacterium]|nr:MAG: sodium:alanine symporter family protein [Candidatus Atribacteria bacterium]